MIVANTKTGRTESFQILDAAQRRDLQSLLASRSVSALAIKVDDQTHSLIQPKRFRYPTEYGFELVMGGNGPIAERVYCQADPVRVSLTHTFDSKIVRCDLVRTGRRKIAPR